MSFRDFKFPQVQKDLGLTLAQDRLFANLTPAVLRESFKEDLEENIRLALAVNTEKAKSEYIIAPILAEAWRISGKSFGLFSGVELNVDASRGLNGVCDFLITQNPMQFYVTSPILAIAEAKNDNPSTGYGQCVSSMVAARLFNEQEGSEARTIYGVSTSGSLWRFMKLDGDRLTLDLDEYAPDRPELLLSVVLSIVAG
jgi:hypothetical protein